MDNNSRVTPEAIRRTLIDFVSLPIILFFGLLSFGPIGGLMAGGDPLRLALNALFLPTGLWGLLAGAAFLKSLMWSERRMQSGFGLNRVLLASYGAVWSTLYLVFVMMPR